MVKNILLILIGLAFGAFVTVYGLRYFSQSTPIANKLLSPLGLQKPEVVGFLPYWLMAKEGKNYSDVLTNLSYFCLTVGPDGRILKYTDENNTETEPGWLALKSGKADKYLKEFSEKNHKRSLVLFSADKENIDLLMSDPVTHARNLSEDVSPIVKEYGFNEINIDIEDVAVATDGARTSFTAFSKTFHDEIKKDNKDIELSIDVSPIVIFKPYLTDLNSISEYYDKVVFMMYDFHYQGSSATGSVSPVNGAGKTEEFDTEVSVEKALEVLSPEKIIVGAPLYGYEWETLSDKPKSGVIPGTGITASSKRVADFLEKCATCSPQFDPVTKESYLIFKNQETNTYHQIFYPDRKSMEEKIKLVKKYKLGGVALWAMGYESDEILEPLKGL